MGLKNNPMSNIHSIFKCIMHWKQMWLNIIHFLKFKYVVISFQDLNALLKRNYRSKYTWSFFFLIDIY